MVSVSAHQNEKLLIFEGVLGLLNFFLGLTTYLSTNKLKIWFYFVYYAILKGHLESKLQRCKRNFIFLKRNIPISLSGHRKLLLYKSLILPIFQYGAPVCFPSSTVLLHFERFQCKVFCWIIHWSSYVSGLGFFSYFLFVFAQKKMTFFFYENFTTGPLTYIVTFFASLPTRYSSNGLFRVPTARKVSSEDNFFIRATGTANDLIRLKKFSFEMPLKTLTNSLINYLKIRTYIFYDINYSCSHFVMCYCTFVMHFIHVCFS